MRITVDTNVLVSALGWNGAEAAIIEMIFESRFELCLSAQILSEFYMVIKYPKFGFTDEEIDGFVGRLLPNVAFADPNDNKIIECAIAGNCSYIISGDKHLLQLEAYEGIKILRSSEFLQLVLQQD